LDPRSLEILLRSFTHQPENGPVKTLLALLLLVSPVYAQDARGGRGGPPDMTAGQPMMQASPILKALDGNHDGVISAAELAGAPAALRTVDRNGDGKLTRDEAAAQLQFGRGPGGAARPGGPGGPPREAEEPPIPGPTADELLATLLGYDKNKDGKLDKNEIPARMQAMVDRGDTNKDGILDSAELKAMAAEQANAPAGGPRGGGGGRGPGGPGGRGSGFGPFDAAASALDTDRNGEISGAEIDAAPTSLKSLDKNTDGQITEDEVRPAIGGRGPGGPQ